jgi:Na+-transporting NADH:ubiquinone oxidoreductase subunit C
VEELVINRAGEVQKNYKAFKEVPEKEQCELLEKGAELNTPDCKLSLFQRVENGNLKALAIPLKGKGLWSTLYGYLALQNDAATVSGITFYKHGETPGLGAEISKKWFQKNFLDKKILDEDGNLYGVVVAKAKAVNSGHPLKHSVDGISGATITANGVTRLIKHCTKMYDPYLSRFRKEE